MPASDPAQIPSLDDDVWLQYADFVKGQLTAGQPLGKDSVLYICPPTYVPMGVSSRSEDVNGRLFTNADAMLAPGAGPLFTPGASSESYFGRIKLLVYHIDPSDGTTVSTKDLDAAQQKLSKFEAQYKAASSDASSAYQDYTEKQARRDEDAKPYNDWVKTNAPDLADLTIGVQNATSQVREAFVETYGESGNEVLDVRDSISSANDVANSHAGLNMPSVFGLPANQDITAADIFYDPAYDLPGYKDLLPTWQSSKNTNYHTFSMRAQSGSSRSWTEYNHQESHVSTGNQIWIIFNDTSSSDDSTTFSNSALEQHLEDIQITLKIKEMAVFPVDHGRWDQPNIRSDFTFTGKVPAAESFIIPTAMLIGYGVGLNAAFGSSSLKEASSAFEKYHHDQSAGMTIFGIQLSTGTSHTTDYKTSKSALTFDQKSQTMSIDPEQNLVPVLLGVLGHSVSI